MFRKRRKALNVDDDDDVCESFVGLASNSLVKSGVWDPYGTYACGIRD